jgi:hypothetical protein
LLEELGFDEVEEEETSSEEAEIKEYSEIPVQERKQQVPPREEAVAAVASVSPRRITSNN